MKELDEINITKTEATIATLDPLSALFLGANTAVTQVNPQEAQNLQSVGSVSVSQIGSSPVDTCQTIVAKAEKADVSSYRIIELREGAHWRATAELYR